MVWLTRIALLEEMYTRICEENGPADPASKALSRDGDLLADSGGDLDKAERWASVAADNYARTYVTVTLKYWQEGCNPVRHTMVL
jgi:hypothetical protein